MSDLREQHAADAGAARAEELTETAKKEYRAWLEVDGEDWGLESFRWFAETEIESLLSARPFMTPDEIFSEWDNPEDDGGPTVSDLT
jgi:hypothetical protein